MSIVTTIYNSSYEIFQQQAFQNVERELSGHSFRVGAALDLLNDGYGIEKIMLKGGWRTESTALRYLRT